MAAPTPAYSSLALYGRRSAGVAPGWQPGGAFRGRRGQTSRAGISQNRRRDLWPSEGVQPLGAARDPLVTLSGSCGQLSDRRQAGEEPLLAMAARCEWFGATASKDSSLELAPRCCLAVTAAQNDSHGDGGQRIHRRFWDTPSRATALTVSGVVRTYYSGGPKGSSAVCFFGVD
jgi:hypothetical protein